MPVPEIEIRPACPQDARIAGRLILDTLYGFGTYMTGLGSDARAAEVMSHYFRLPGNRFSYQFTYTAVEGKKVVGLLLAFPGKIFKRVNRIMTIQMIRIYSPAELVELIRRTLILKDEEDVERDEFYIAHLAVDAACRRRGIGRALLKFAEEEARGRGLTKLSLMAEIENETAVALYEKSGFRTTRTYLHPHQIPLTGSPGYVKMIKDI